MPSQFRFTLRDLIVAVAVIALVLGLLTPWFQRLREEARRTQCRNNLKQIGLALHNYHDIHNCFPAGIFTDSPDLRRGYCNGLVVVTPYLEKNPWYNTYNLRLPWSHCANTTAVSSNYWGTAFLCPTNRVDGNLNDLGLRAAVTDYGLSKGAVAALCLGTESADFPSTLQGMFDVNSHVRFKDVRDGLSLTLMAGEIAGGRYSGKTRDGKTVTVDQAMCKADMGDAIAPALGGVGSILAVVLQHPGADQRIGGTDDVNAPLNPTTITLPRDESRDSSCRNLDDRVNEFRSAHRGGAHFLFGDGTVRWVSELVDPRTYGYLGTIAGKEIVDDDCF